MDSINKIFFGFFIFMSVLIGLGVYTDHIYKMEKLRLIEKGVLTTVAEKV